MFDLAGHDRFLDAFIFEEANHFAELADANPRQTIGYAFNFRIGFFANSGDGDLRAGLTRAFQHQKRKPAVAGNQTDFHCFQRSGQ